MHFLIGLVAVAAVIYFAFVRNPDDTAEQAIVKIARVVMFFLVIIAILVILLLNGYFD